MSIFSVQMTYVLAEVVELPVDAIEALVYTIESSVNGIEPGLELLTESIEPDSRLLARTRKPFVHGSEPFVQCAFEACKCFVQDVADPSGSSDDRCNDCCDSTNNRNNDGDNLQRHDGHTPIIAYMISIFYLFMKVFKANHRNTNLQFLTCGKPFP